MVEKNGQSGQLDIWSEARATMKAMPEGRGNEKRTAMDGHRARDREGERGERQEARETETKNGTETARE